jgi:hypothetical protein
MKQAVLAHERRTACFIHLREKKEKRLCHPLVPEEQFSIEGANNRRTNGKCFGKQKAAEPF